MSGTVCAARGQGSEEGRKSIKNKPVMGAPTNRHTNTHERVCTRYDNILSRFTVCRVDNNGSIDEFAKNGKFKFAKLDIWIQWRLLGSCTFTYSSHVTSYFRF